MAARELVVGDVGIRIDVLVDIVVWLFRVWIAVAELPGSGGVVACLSGELFGRVGNVGFIEACLSSMILGRDACEECPVHEACHVVAPCEYLPSL